MRETSVDSRYWGRVAGTTVELGLYAFFISLLYKQAALGLLALMVIIFAGALVKIASKHLTKSSAVFAILYVFAATVTAFQVGTGEGVYRTIQFVTLVMAGVVLSNYLNVVGSRRREKILRRMFVLCTLIFMHVALYHFATGHFTTWKYLYDTKTVISLIVIVLFANEDAFVARLGLLGWIGCIALVAFLILLSGERKAYLLLFVAFFACRLPFLFKGAVTAFAAIFLVVYLASASQGSYVARQIKTILEPDRQMQVSEFYLVEGIGDQSDIIRDFVNRNAREQFQNHPWFGLGATGYQQWSNANFNDAAFPTGLSMNVHGEVNRIPAENGLFGIFIALAFIVTVTLALIKSYSNRLISTISSRERVLFYCYCMVIIYAMFEALDTTMLSFILVLGLEAARIQYASNGKSDRTKSIRRRDAII